MQYKIKLARISAILAAAFFLAILGNVAPIPFLSNAEKSIAQAAGPEVTILPKKVEYKSRVQVFISGSGFKPKQELGLRITMGGVLSDVSYLVKPRPISNANGSFASIWTLNREIGRKLIKLGSHDLMVVDEDGNELAKGKISFKKAKSRGKKGKKSKKRR